MAVTKNVYLALRDLRYKEEDRVLWIDALCINQDDDVERGLQVQQMGSIYSMAERVLIWLGESCYDADCAMYYMEQLQKEGAQLSSGTRDILNEEWVQLWKEVIYSLRPDQRGVLREGCQNLLGRAWFKRVWIIQEAVNARAAEIVCGGRSVSATIFALMPSLLEFTPEPQCQPILEVMPGPPRNRSWLIKKRDLHTMLTKFSRSEATDPRDNIYALLGISSDACNTELLRPNYEKSIRDVVADTVSFLLNFNQLESDSLIRGFFNCLHWTWERFRENVGGLANEVLKDAMSDSKYAPIVRQLVLRDDIDRQLNVNDDTPLMWLLGRSGNEEIVKLLFATGKEKIFPGALSIPAKNGFTELVKLLLDTEKVDVNFKDPGGRTPLSWAAHAGSEAVVKLLLETHGVEIDVRDSDGQSPLWCAASTGSEAVVKLLLETGRVDPDSKDRFGETPLLKAAYRNSAPVVKMLLETGKVDVNQGSTSGAPIFYALIHNQSEEIVEMLLETGRVYINTKDYDGMTPVGRLCRECRCEWKLAKYPKKHLLEEVDFLCWHEKMVKRLLETGKADLDSRDNEGYTPLDLAVALRAPRMAKLLLETGKVSVDAKNEYGNTALFRAISDSNKNNSNEAIIKVLLEIGKADIRVRDSAGRTPIERARDEKHESIVKLLEDFIAQNPSSALSTEEGQASGAPGAG